jgi:hypothetical protein
MNDKGRYRQHPKQQRLKPIRGGIASDQTSKAIIQRILKLLFASDASLRCLHRSVAKQKLKLFQFASTTIARPGVVRRRSWRTGYLCWPGQRTASPRRCIDF